MLRKSLIKITVVAALGLAVLGGTAAAANADSGSAKFGMGTGFLDFQSGQVSVSPAYCNLANHRASFDVSVTQPPQYTNGIWFSDIVYMRDVSANGPWRSTGQVTQAINTAQISNGVAYNQPMNFSRTNVAGIAGHYYQFQVDFNWAPPGGYWQGWQYFDVDPFSWIFQNGSVISGYLYCHL